MRRDQRATTAPRDRQHRGERRQTDRANRIGRSRGHVAEPEVLADAR
jgi:hypothetical protein